MGAAAARVKPADKPEVAPKKRKFCVKIAPHELNMLTQHTRTSALEIVPSFSLDPARPVQKSVVMTTLTKEQLATRLFCRVADIEEVFD